MLVTRPAPVGPVTRLVVVESLPDGLELVDSAECESIARA
jgi:hypothetical protein